MTLPNPPRYWKFLTDLRDCLCENLAMTVSGPPARCCLVAGQVVALDDCCDGTAWVRVDLMVPSNLDVFPDVSQSSTPCGHTVAAITVALGVARCAHTMDNDGNVPCCEELEQEALVAASDLDALLRTAYCCIPEGQDNNIDLLVNSYIPFGPEGGCVGGEMSVTYAMELCPCQEDPPPQLGWR